MQFWTWPILSKGVYPLGEHDVKGSTPVSVRFRAIDELDINRKVLKCLLINI